MSILMFLLFGLIVGLLARAIMPGRQSMGLLATALIGAVGSFVGGVIGNLVIGAPILTIHTTGFIGSILGALLVLFLVGFSARARHSVA